MVYKSSSRIVLLFLILLSLAFFATEAQSYIDVSVPRDKYGSDGTFRKGSPLDMNVNITYDYPLPLEPGQTVFSAELYLNGRLVPNSTKTMPLSDKLKEAIGGANAYTFNPKYFDFSVDLYYQNVTYTPIPFTYNFSRQQYDLQTPQLDPNNVQTIYPSGGDRLFCYKKFSVKQDTFTSYEYHNDETSCTYKDVPYKDGDWDFVINHDHPIQKDHIGYEEVGRFLAYVCKRPQNNIKFGGMVGSSPDNNFRMYVEDKVVPLITSSHGLQHYLWHHQGGHDPLVNDSSGYFTSDGYIKEGCYKLELYLQNIDGWDELKWQAGKFSYYNFDYMDSSSDAEPVKVYPGNNLWLTKNAIVTQWPTQNPVDNYCSGPADFEEGTGRIKSLKCSGEDAEVTVGNWVYNAYEPNPFSTNISYGGCKPKTSYMFSAYITTRKILNIPLGIAVNDGMSIYLDGQKVTSCGCTGDQCNDGSFGTCSKTLTITPGLHNLTIYFYNAEGSCKLLIDPSNFADLCRQIQNTSACDYFYQLFEGFDKDPPTTPYQDTGNQLADISSDKGPTNVRGFEGYLETGRYYGLLSNESNKVNLSFRTACGGEDYAECAKTQYFGSNCRTDKYGWVLDRQLKWGSGSGEPDNWRYYDNSSTCGTSVGDVVFTIEPFDHHSIDGYRSKYRADGEEVGGVYKCKGIYSDLCDYSYNDICCMRQPWNALPPSQKASWDGNKGEVTICDFDQTYTYIINYLPYYGGLYDMGGEREHPCGDNETEPCNFTMFDVRPKVCAYTSASAEDPVDIDATIEFTNTLCNTTTGDGQCCMCTSQHQCKLECVQCTKWENGVCVDYTSLADGKKLYPGTYFGDFLGTDPQGYKWEINANSLNLSNIIVTDPDVRMAFTKTQPDPVNNPTNVWFNLSAEWFQNYKNVLFKNYTIIVNLKNVGFYVPDWTWEHADINPSGRIGPDVDWKGKNRNYTVKMNLTYNTTDNNETKTISNFTNFTAAECLSPGLKWANAIYNSYYGGKPGFGICKAGTLTCSINKTWFYNMTTDMPVYPRNPVYPYYEKTCDGLDEDCDGITDDIGGMESLIRQFRQYGGNRTFAQITKCGCFNGAQPADEKCNGIDDDCDGVVDNKNKIILLNKCDQDVQNCMAQGNPYIWCAQMFYGSSQCGLAYAMVIMPEKIYVNPCTEAVKKCTETGYMPGGDVPSGGGHAVQVSGLPSTMIQSTGEKKIMFIDPYKSPFINFTYQQCSAIYANPKCEIQEKEFITLNDTCACSDGTAPGTNKEICNGIDDDCNGMIDDVQYPLTCACSMQTNISLIHQLKSKTQDICNGMDDNCNGKIDETARSCACTNRQASDVVNISSVLEICDNVDNNCNGLVDENFPNLGKDCGTGACSNGAYVCGVHGDELVCNTTVSAEQTFTGKAKNLVRSELCDLLDNNCDYSIDEECECTPSDMGVTKVCGYDSSKYYKSMAQIQAVCDQSLDMISRILSWEYAPGNSKYRRAITITNNNEPDFKNYPVYIELDTESLISQGKLRPDAGDLRIVDENGTIIEWYMETPARQQPPVQVTSGSSAELASSSESLVKNIAQQSSKAAETSASQLSQSAQRLASSMESAAAKQGVSQETKNLLEQRSSEIRSSLSELGSELNEMKTQANSVVSSTTKTSVNSLVNSAESVQNVVESVKGAAEMVQKESPSMQLSADDLQTITNNAASVATAAEETNSDINPAIQMQGYLGSSKIWFKLNIKPGETRYYYVYYGDPSAIYSMKSATEIRGLTREREMFFLCHFDGSYACEGNTVPMVNIKTTFRQGVYGRAVQTSTTGTLRYPTSANINKERGAIAFWLLGSQTANSYLLYEKSFGAREQISIYTLSSKIYFDIYDRSGIKHSVSAPVTGNWTRVLATWDVLKGMALYLNGQVQMTRSETWTMDDLGTDFWIGSKENVSSAALFDEFVVYTQYIDEAYAKKEARSYLIETGVGTEEDIAHTQIREAPREIFDKCNSFLGRVTTTLTNTTRAGTILSLCNSILICNKTFNINPRSTLTLGWQNCTGGSWSECQGLIEPTQETCNWMDENGNGIVDDVQFPETCGCYNPLNLSEGKPPSQEICNGVDDDCNGIIDDVGGLSGIDQTYCGCYNMTVNVSMRPLEPEPNLCNSIDDNCNNIIDEGVDDCACTNTDFWNITNFRGYEICNYIDDDCNGQIDEVFKRPANSTTPVAYLGDSCSFINSVCAGGVYVCGATGRELVCSTTTPPEGSWGELSIDLRQEEKVNSIDDNCNGIIDDIYGEESGKYVQCYQGRSPQIELCNGRDDDCDAMIDNGVSSCACADLGEINASSAEYIVSQIKLKKVSPELCNNFDDNCNGKIDEGLDNCACSGGYAGDPSLRPEFCNGMDDNCNGVIDDIPNTDACACYNDAHKPGELQETCNSGDENCNGLIDETWPQLGQGCGIGACSGGVYFCEQNSAVCSSATKSSDEKCDSLDNDCDGYIDENCPCNSGESRQCGANLGLCKIGSQVCQNSVWGECTGAVFPVIETCNGMDENCDGIVDNIGGRGSITDTKCGCYGGAQPSTETCNGIDDDCDGTVDDVEGQTCGCTGNAYGVGSKKETCNGIDDDCNGVIDDVNGGNSISSTACGCYGGSQPTDEICDLIDNNCNGAIDELWPELGADCATGVCSGRYVCSEGKVTCNGNQPEVEICDNKDNNCDGKIDEGCYVGSSIISSCENGMKDDNEQQVDCGGICKPCEQPQIVKPPTAWIGVFIVLVIVIIVVGLLLSFMK